MTAKQKLNFVLGYLESMARNLKALSPDNEATRELLDKIYKSIERLKEKTDGKPNP